MVQTPLRSLSELALGWILVSELAGELGHLAQDASEGTGLILPIFDLQAPENNTKNSRFSLLFLTKTAGFTPIEYLGLDFSYYLLRLGDLM